eukprot:3866289-Amphidinium_carterae.1
MTCRRWNPHVTNKGAANCTSRQVLPNTQHIKLLQQRFASFHRFGQVQLHYPGAIVAPSSLNVHVVALGHNLLGGPLPQRLFGGSQKAQKCVLANALGAFPMGTRSACPRVCACSEKRLDACHSKGWIIVPSFLVWQRCVQGMILPRALLNEWFLPHVSLGRSFVVVTMLSAMLRRGIGSCVLTKVDALFHEGTIPESASRLTTAAITINVGHGLRGILPSIPGTVGVL